MQKSTWIALLVVAVLIVGGFVLARSLFYSSGSNNYQPPQHELIKTDVQNSAVSARVDAVDNPTVSDGTVIVDFAHDNALYVEELNVLFSNIVERGYSYELLTPTDNEEEGTRLIDRLVYADSLILPLPRAMYSPEEVTAIENFVKKGGKLFIIGDPTRTTEVEGLNSVAGNFGIIYADDYLYSQGEGSNDNNYRNVIYSNFSDTPITEGLSNGDRVIFYSGSSLNAPGHEVIMGDENTHSSTSEGGRNMAVAVLTTDDQVLALGDLTFFTEPYSAAESNGVLINNIANFLTANERTYELKDFPYFFNDNIDVVFDDTLVFNSQFEDTVKLKNLLEDADKTVSFTNQIGDENDVIYIGRFDEVEAVQDYLDTAKISFLATQPKIEADVENSDEITGTEFAVEENGKEVEEEDTDKDQDFVEGRIKIKNIGDLEQGGSTLFYLHQTDDNRNMLFILSDNPDTNADAYDLLTDHSFTDCLVNPLIAVCQTEIPDKQLQPSVRSTRINKVLIVSDEDGRPRAEAKTGAENYADVLSDTYKLTTWNTSKEGSPDLDELQEYDAVIWTTGDYWDDSIGSEDAETLTNYIEEGGNLILSGASIAFDWDHTNFLSNIVHANYVSFAEQADVEVVLDDHPIAKGIEAGTVFTLTVTGTDDEEPLQPDVVSHTADARVIFQRGPNSEMAGAASVIAYEDDRAKIAYYAFPLYLLPDELQSKLVNNTLDWFTRKSLDLPDEDDYEPFEPGGEIQDEEPPTDEETPTDGEETPADGGEDTGGEEQEGEDTNNDAG